MTISPDPASPGSPATVPGAEATPPTTPPAYVGYTPLASHVLTFVGNGNVVGDGNHLREEIGNLWSVKTDPATKGKFLKAQNLPVYETENLNGIPIERASSRSPHIRSIEINPCMVKIAQEGVAVPNYLIPVRLYSTLDLRGGDVFWNALFMGGEFGEITYPALIPSNTIYYNTMFKYPIPYSILEMKESNLPDASTYTGAGFAAKPYDVSYVYNIYLRDYETTINTMESELLIPNFYLYKYLNAAPREYKSYATLQDILSVSQITRGEFGSKAKASSYLENKFSRTNFNENLQSEIINMQQNIMFDDNYYKTERYSIRPELDKSLFPYYVKIDLPHHAGIDAHNHSFFKVRDSIMRNNFSAKFLEILKDVYDDDFPDVTPATLSYTMQKTSLTSSIVSARGSPRLASDVRVVETTDVSGISFKTIDFLEFLTFIYNNYSASLNDNYTFIGNHRASREATYSSTGFDRYFNNQNVMGVIDDTVKYTRQILNNNPLKYMNLQNVINLQQNPAETLAYRIEKIGGPPVGDSGTQSVLQNFWFFNSADIEPSLQFFDTQVKYGEKYTYNCYAYVVVPSYRYRYSNLRLTKQIAKIDTDGDGFTDLFCLQFYDPLTNNFAKQLFYEGDGRYTVIPDSVSEYLDVELLGGGFGEIVLPTLEDLGLTTPPEMGEMIPAGAEGGAGPESGWGPELIGAPPTIDMGPPGSSPPGGDTSPSGDYTMEADPSWTSPSGDYTMEADPSWTPPYVPPPGPWGGATESGPMPGGSMTPPILPGGGSAGSGGGSAGSGGSSYTPGAAPMPAPPGLDSGIIPFVPMATCTTSILSMRNEYSTDLQDLSDSPHVADFYVHIEPCFKLLEIPIFSKMQMVLDNPGNGASIYPFQYLDNSQKVGFEVSYESHISRPFPRVVTAADQELKDNYLFANNLLLRESISKPSVSRARYVEIFRTDVKPTKFTDFEGKVVSVIDLKIEDTEYTYADTIYEAEINTNKKYYYLFRFLNEHGMISHPAEIMECELINDGGYLYALFSVLYEEQLKEAFPTQTTTAIKKLFQIQPNARHLALDTREVDYRKSASSQIGNLRIGKAKDLIWGKIFKLRMISKKTGRKLDLNINFKLQEDPTTPPSTLPAHLPLEGTFLGPEVVYHGDTSGIIEEWAGAFELGGADWMHPSDDPFGDFEMDFFDPGSEVEYMHFDGGAGETVLPTEIESLESPVFFHYDSDTLGPVYEAYAYFDSEGW